jgi:hypothetical protein
VIVCNLSKAGMGPTRWKAYNSNFFGSHDFQIDLAIDLMEYSIGLDWDRKSNARSIFMPKSSLLPCECIKCFFCENGLTNGIAHQASKKAKVAKITVEYKCGTRVTSNECTTEQVNLGLKAARYCRMCYQKQSPIESTSEVRKWACGTSVMGCSICKEPICKEHWNDGKDTHAKFYLENLVSS